MATERLSGLSGSESTGFKAGWMIDFEVEPPLVQEIGSLVTAGVTTRSAEGTAGVDSRD